MPSRRTVLAGLTAAAALPLLPPPMRAARAAPGDLHRKPIPATGALIPVIGMGTWITFNIGDLPPLRAQRTEVMRAFFEGGGGVIDSSPMYGTAEEVIGHGLSALPPEATGGLISATKVWTLGQDSGRAQMAESRALWGVERFDLMQIHNMVDWEAHLETLQEHKRQGLVGLIGMTTSHGRRHADFARAMEIAPLDVVQVTYNILDREAERRLLPLAAERGMAVIANRPFRQKELFRLVGDAPMPGWAAEIGAENWAQVFLKFIVSHPAVTCAIPATSRVDHMRENMGALHGPLPDAALRERMARDVAALV